MSRYSGWERKLAQMLDAFPSARRRAKWGYQRLSYLIHREPGFRYDIHEAASIEDVSRWGGFEDRDVPLFFGYYDKTPWSPDMQSLLMHRPVDGGKVEVVALQRGGTRSNVLGTTPAWNWQQGAMAQWLSNHTVVFNAVEDARLGSRIVDIQSGTARFVPWPVQTVHPGGREAVSLNYKRLHRLRPEYGYAPAVSNFAPDMPADRDGLWRVDLETGEAELMVSLAQLRAHQPRPEMEGADHKVNHAMYSPEGTRLVFMHRWLGADGKFSRLYVADADGTNRRLLLDDRMVSHYYWRDEEHLLAWARTEACGDRYYRIDVTEGTWEILGEGVLDRFGDGHPSYAPNRYWIVTDTYPDKARQRRLLLYNTRSGERIELGRFFAPWAFDGPDRCDLHPRWSPDGNYISIDSAHTGIRKSYILDVRNVVNGNGRSSPGYGLDERL